MVIEKVALNHVMPVYEMISDEKDQRMWFEFVSEEADKRSHDIRKAIVPCECPEDFKSTIGFF